MLTAGLWFLAAFLVFHVVAAALAIWAMKYMHDRDMAEFAARRDPSNEIQERKALKEEG